MAEKFLSIYKKHTLIAKHEKNIVLSDENARNLEKLISMESRVLKDLIEISMMMKVYIKALADLQLFVHNSLYFAHFILGV